MNNADKSIRRINEIGRSMNALVPHPLSRPATRMPSAQEILKHERELAKQKREDAPRKGMDSADRIVLAGSIVACVVLAAILIIERLA